MEKVFSHFMAVALHGSLSSASQSLGISQPAISKSIKLLEERYKTKLLVRKARGVELTPAGKILLERTVRIENELLAIKNDIHALNSEREQLRIGAGPAWEQPINAMLSNFFLEFPNVHMEIRSNSIAKLIPDLLTNSLDLALGGEDGALLVEHNELSFIPLIETRLCIVAGARHQLAQKRRCQLEELTQYPWVGYQYSKDMLRQINQLLDRERLNPVNFMLETEFLDVALTLVEKNDALLCISDILLEKVRDQGVVAIQLDQPIWHFHIGIWIQATIQHRPLVNQFIDAIKQQAALYRLNNPVRL